MRKYGRDCMLRCESERPLMHKQFKKGRKGWNRKERQTPLLWKASCFRVSYVHRFYENTESSFTSRELLQISCLFLDYSTKVNSSFYIFVRHITCMLHFLHKHPTENQKMPKSLLNQHENKDTYKQTIKWNILYTSYSVNIHVTWLTTCTMCCIGCESLYMWLHIHIYSMCLT